MSLFNLKSLITTLALCSSLSVAAQESDGESTASMGELKLTTVSLSYLSWTEFVDLDDGTFTDRAYANFYGNALAIERESFTGRHGYALEGALLMGQANAGGTQTVITYQTSYQKWTGLMATARYAYRVSPQITMSIGPLALSRQMNWPSEGTNVDVKSGSPMNFGILGDLRLRLTRDWELKQTIGTLAFKASTIWSLGVGYKF